jgi:hypothetical protein
MEIAAAHKYLGNKIYLLMHNKSELDSMILSFNPFLFQKYVNK